MKKMNAVLTIGVSVAVAASAFAAPVAQVQPKSRAQMTQAGDGNRQNDAGCGLGSMVFKENKPTDQILAATTNGTAGNQTFGITSGTLNCGGSNARVSMVQESFVIANMRDLSREMAIGKGEYVTSLASLMGCADKTSFGAFTQSNYETLFPSQGVTPNQLLQTLRTEMAKDTQLSRSCSAL